MGFISQSLHSNFIVFIFYILLASMSFWYSAFTCSSLAILSSAILDLCHINQNDVFGLFERFGDIFVTTYQPNYPFCLWVFIFGKITVCFLPLHPSQRYSGDAPSVDSHDQRDRRPPGGSIRQSLPLQGKTCSFFTIFFSPVSWFWAISYLSAHFHRLFLSLLLPY